MSESSVSPQRTQSLVLGLAWGAVLLTLACTGPAQGPSPSGGEAQALPSAAAAAPAAAAGAAPSAAPIPQGAPHGAGAGERALSQEGAAISTPTFRFELPASWQREQPSSAMRLAQAVLPGESGPGELAVFHFGAGQGGSVESNFERWLGQVERAAGSQPERGEFAAGDFQVHWIDARGTLLPSTMGSGPSSPQSGFRLLGAVVEGEGGPWFFKITGPEATLGHEREAFLAMLHAVRRP